MSLPFRTDAFKYSFLGPLPIGITFHWLFASRSRSRLSLSKFHGAWRSAELGILLSLLIIMTLRR